MTDQAIGTARIDIVVDTTKMQAGINTAQRTVSQFGTQAEAEYNRASTSSKRYADSLLRQVDMLGKTRAEQIAYNAQTRIGGQLGDQLAAKALAQGAALKVSADGANKLQFAFSGLRSQVTQLLAGFLGFEA